MNRWLRGLLLDQESRRRAGKDPKEAELQHKRKGQHSIRINKQWRICFTWKGSDAYDVGIVDYH